MKITPLRGKCLIEILPHGQSTGGIAIPETAKLTRGHEKLPPTKAIVREIGPWKQGKNGFAILPPFRKGDMVIVSQYIGTRLSGEERKNFRIVQTDDVLALLTDRKPVL